MANPQKLHAPMERSSKFLLSKRPPGCWYGVCYIIYLLLGFTFYIIDFFFINL